MTKKLTGVGTSVFSDEPKVLITGSGKAYHTYHRCRYLDYCAGSIEVTRKYAEYRGKRPCAECEPR